MKHGEVEELDHAAFCPNCGSTDLFFASGLPQMWSIWDCRNCGYRGPVVVEDGELAEKLREDWKKDRSPNGRA